MIPDAVVRYRVTTNGEPAAGSLTYENSAFRLEFSSGAATFNFRLPVGSLKEAVERSGAFLRSWEGDQLLQTSPQRLEFSLLSFSAPGHRQTTILAKGTATVAGPLAEANRRLYQPWTAHRYSEDPLIGRLITRYEEARAGHEKLAASAYFCLSALESEYSGRRCLADVSRIDYHVLQQLGELVSAVGDLASARKIDKARHQHRELSDAEAFWIERVMSALLSRIGEYRLTQQRPETLTFKDLPPL